MEKKTSDAAGQSQEARFTIKDKWVKPLLDGEYEMEKTVQKMERQGQPTEQIDSFKSTVSKIRDFMQQKKLSPVLRANYARTAFQKPADDRVRIAIDTDLAFIREDTLDRSRPCRDPNNWHRSDIDDSNMTYPFKNINQSEISKFPHAVLEIKLREHGRRRPVWVEDLMSSHLVHPVPRFSKFVHGMASLFEDYVNNLPFWLSDLETDIRKDPQKAFEEEEQRRAQRADDVHAVGSLIGAKSASYKGGSYKATKSSPVGTSYLADRMATEASRRQSSAPKTTRPSSIAEEQDDHTTEPQQHAGYGTLSSVIPSFSLSKYSRAQRTQQINPLPEGVVKPKTWIKNAGELKIEPKVWLANERTFLKWQHICILQGSLALALYSAAGENLVAEIMGIVYISIAAFAGGWGYWMLKTRRQMIVERSGKDFDNLIGPVIIAVAMMGALILNFVFQVRDLFFSQLKRFANIVQYRQAFERFNEGKEQPIVLGELKL